MDHFITCSCSSELRLRALGLYYNFIHWRYISSYYKVIWDLQGETPFGYIIISTTDLFAVENFYLAHAVLQVDIRCFSMRLPLL